MSQTMISGFIVDSRSNPRPMRAAAPGARFCTTTSALSSTRRSSALAPSGCLTSSVTLSLDRLVHEVRGQPADPGVVAAGEVAGAGTLDLDHAGAEVGEL